MNVQRHHVWRAGRILMAIISVIVIVGLVYGLGGYAWNGFWSFYPSRAFAQLIGWNPPRLGHPTIHGWEAGGASIGFGSLPQTSLEYALREQEARKDAERKNREAQEAATLKAALRQAETDKLRLLSGEPSPGCLLQIGTYDRATGENLTEPATIFVESPFGTEQYTVTPGKDWQIPATRGLTYKIWAFQSPDNAPIQSQIETVPYALSDCGIKYVDLWFER